MTEQRSPAHSVPKAQARSNADGLHPGPASAQHKPSPTSPTDESLRDTWEQELGPVLSQEPSLSVDYNCMFQQLTAHLQREQTQPRWYEWTTPQRYSVVLAVVFVLAGLILWLRPRADLLQYPVPRMILILSLLALLLVVHVWYLLRPLYKPASSWPVQQVLPWVGLALPLALAWWPLSHHATVSSSLPHTLKDSAICLVLGCLFAAPFLWLSWRVARHHHTGYVLLSSAAGGLAGNLVLQLFCPKFAVMHMVLGHATVGFLLLLLFYSFRRPASA